MIISSLNIVSVYPEKLQGIYQFVCQLKFSTHLGIMLVIEPHKGKATRPGD